MHTIAAAQASASCTAILDGCGQKLPRIKQPAVDKLTPWETKTLKVLKAINGWEKMRDLDRRNMVWRYSALIYRMADNQLLSQPLATATQLVDLVPVFENQINVTKWDEDNASERYGQPQTFQYRARKVGGIDTPKASPRGESLGTLRMARLAEGEHAEVQLGIRMVPLWTWAFRRAHEVAIHESRKKGSRDCPGYSLRSCMAASCTWGWAAHRRLSQE